MAKRKIGATQVTVSRWDCRCGKCGREWQSRDETKPTMCRFCKSRGYEQPK